MAVNVNRMKNPRAAKNQQQGSIRFFLQQELDKSKVISRLKNNLEGVGKDGSYKHKVTGALEKSIYPNKDGQKVWGKNIVSKIRVDDYLGLGIGIDEVSVKIDMLSYGDDIDQGKKIAVQQNTIYGWVLKKAKRWPSDTWYARGRQITGAEMTTSDAWNISYYVTAKINDKGLNESNWIGKVLKGKEGLNGALDRAYLRYLNQYDDYAYATVINKLDKMLSKL